MEQRSDKPTISLCMIVKNEEEFLENCLRSVSGVADEIVVIDTGSSDRTMEIAQKHGARIYTEKWQDDFSLMRNKAIDRATGDWILVLDADEWLDDTSKAQILNAVKDDRFDAYELQQINYYSDEAADSIVNLTFRLWRNRPEYRYQGRIHENIADPIRSACGRYTRADINFHHAGNRPDLARRNTKNKQYIELLKMELAGDPDNPVRLYEMSSANLISRQYEESIKCLEHALLHVDLNTRLGGLIYSSLAVAYWQLDMLEKVLEILDRAEKVKVKHPEIHFTAGTAFKLLGQYDKAVSQLEEAVRLGNDGDWIGDAATWGYKAHQEIAVNYFALGYYRKAIENAMQVLKTKPENAEAHLICGEAYFRLGSMEKAAEHFTKSAEYKQNNAQAINGLGQIYFAQGKTTEALECFVQAVKMDSTFANAYFNAGDILYSAGEYESAADLYSGGLTHRPSHASGFFMLGNCYLRMGAAESAIIAYHQALSIKPDYPEALNNLQIAEESTMQSKAA